MKSSVNSSMVLETFVFVLFLFIVSVVSVYFVSAAGDFNCTIMENQSCSLTKVIYLENYTGGYWNAHAQNVSVGTYDYVICCNSNSTLSNACGEGVFLKLNATSNSHVQRGDYSGPGIVYGIDVCLTTTPGYFNCTYVDDSCPGNRECFASMASSNATVNNDTNAHIGPCQEYKRKVCCRVSNVAPTHTTPLIVSSSGNNCTSDNITCYNQSTYDENGDSVTNIYNWYKDNVSITVLNMPFDTNFTATDNSIAGVKDYSPYANNGSLGNATAGTQPVWNSSGGCVSGGCYTFDGSDDYIDCGDTESLNISGDAVTVEAWVNILNFTTGRILAKYNSYALKIVGSYGIQFKITTGSTTDIETGPLLTGKWYHVVGTYNGSKMMIYLNGELNNSEDKSGSISPDPGENFLIGVKTPGTSEGYFNGTIDEVKVYNISLSAAQIYRNYLEGKNNYTNSTITSSETSNGEEWKCGVTPNDGENDGIALNSSVLTIKTPPGKVTLTSPANGAHFTNLTPTFQWEVPIDVDGDSINYTINISCFKIGGGDCSSDDVYDNSTTNSYTPSKEFQYFGDDNYYYNWSVRARDDCEYGEESDKWNFTIDTNVSISLINDLVDFGEDRPLGYEDNTSDDNPNPFVLQNDGNCMIDANISALDDLWISKSVPSYYFNYSVGWVSGEEGSFNWSGSTTSWTNVPLVNNTFIDSLNYTDINDSSEIDIQILVPLDEPAGTKSSNIIFTGWYVG